MPSSNTGCTIEVRLKPNARRETIALGDNGVINARVNAPPVEGKANIALIKFLSKTLDIPKSSLSIKRGETSKNKVIAVVGLTKEQIIQKIPEDARMRFPGRTV
jgi:uncharacterized protein